MLMGRLVYLQRMTICLPLEMEEYLMGTQHFFIPRVHTQCSMLEVNTSAVSALAKRLESLGLSDSDYSI